VSKPAAFLGTYVDLKFLSGLKVARVTLEIPIERSQEFIGMFGTPNKADPAWCALARINVAALNAPSVPEKAVEPAKVEKAAPKRSSLAAMLCKNSEGFQAWLVDTYWTGKEDIGDYDGLLKRALGITSKTEIDNNPDKAEAWERMLTTFKHRHTVRA
jgi:hypothetical protein